MEITSKIFALGNSNAIRLPRIIMEALSLKADDPILIEITDQEEIVIKRQKPTGYPSIRELFAGYQGNEKAKELPASGMVGRELI